VGYPWANSTDNLGAGQYSVEKKNPKIKDPTLSKLPGSIEQQIPHPPEKRGDSE
jgi:hypothetical protein